MASVLLNFVSCVAFNEVFAAAAGYSQLKAGEVPNLCVLAAAAVLVQAVVFIHASGKRVLLAGALFAGVGCARRRLARVTRH